MNTSTEYTLIFPEADNGHLEAHIPLADTVALVGVSKEPSAEAESDNGELLGIAVVGLVAVAGAIHHLTKHHNTATPEKDAHQVVTIAHASKHTARGDAKYAAKQAAKAARKAEKSLKS